MTKAFSLQEPLHYLDWPAPDNVVAGFTSRFPGYSANEFNGFNLAHHVGDDSASVNANRDKLKQLIQKEVCWLSQTHSTLVVEAATENIGVEADASWTRTSNMVAAVMTADCLPVFLCDEEGSQVAVIHAGWRGLLNGIIENTLKTFEANGGQILAYLGPAIGPNAFEVGEEVRMAFMDESTESTSAFVPGQQSGKWMADIYALAKIRLARYQVENVFGGQYCTHEMKDQFYSYRRDGQTGRMANLIWKR